MHGSAKPCSHIVMNNLRRFRFRFDLFRKLLLIITRLLLRVKFLRLHSRALNDNVKPRRSTQRIRRAKSDANTHSTECIDLTLFLHSCIGICVKNKFAVNMRTGILKKNIVM